MNKPTFNKTVLAGFLILLSSGSWGNERDALLEQYSQQGSTIFSAERGQKLWEQSVDGKAPFTSRSCTSCHSQKIKNNGQHIKTKKQIDPMATSVNPSRLTKTKKIEKWFKRNCKWTFGRECSIQEKGDIITYLESR